MQTILNNANETWLQQAIMLINMWRMCLSPKLTRAKEMEPLDFLAHTVSCLEAPFLADVGEQKHKPDNEGDATSYFLPGAHLLKAAWDCLWPHSTANLADMSKFHTVLIVAQETQNGAPKLLLSPSPPTLLPSPMLLQLTPHMGVLLLEYRQKVLIGKGGHREEKCTATQC